MSGTVRNDGPSLTVTLTPAEAYLVGYALQCLPRAAQNVAELPPAVVRLREVCNHFAVDHRDRSVSDPVSVCPPFPDRWDEWTSTQEAARQLGCGPRRVVRMLQDGRLRGLQPNGGQGHWRIDPQSVLEQQERTT